MPSTSSCSLRLQRIKEIRAAGLEVSHVIHRHAIKSTEMALQIDAALIDAYPGLTNKAAGHDSDSDGCRHIEEIVAVYRAEPFEVTEPLILISIKRSYDEVGKSIYDAVRGVWRMKRENAEKYPLVSAHRQGIVMGAHVPEAWLPGTREHFPWLPEDAPSRIGFVGREADAATRARYVRRRVPDRFRARGARHPVRYVDGPGDASA